MPATHNPWLERVQSALLSQKAYTLVLASVLGVSEHLRIWRMSDGLFATDGRSEPSSLLLGTYLQLLIAYVLLRLLVVATPILVELSQPQFGRSISSSNSQHQTPFNEPEPSSTNTKQPAIETSFKTVLPLSLALLSNLLTTYYTLTFYTPPSLESAQIFIFLILLAHAFITSERDLRSSILFAICGVVAGYNILVSNQSANLGFLRENFLVNILPTFSGTAVFVLLGKRGLSARQGDEGDVRRDARKTSFDSERGDQTTTCKYLSTAIFYALIALTLFLLVSTFQNSRQTSIWHISPSPFLLLSNGLLYSLSLFSTALLVQSTSTVLASYIVVPRVACQLLQRGEIDGLDLGKMVVGICCIAFLWAEF